MQSKSDSERSRISNKNTIDSQRNVAQEALNHSTSAPSANHIQDLTERDQHRKGGTAEKTLPYQEPPSNMNETGQEFLHLNDPKNYKFLPP